MEINCSKCKELFVQRPWQLKAKHRVCRPCINSQRRKDVKRWRKDPEYAKKIKDDAARKRREPGFYETAAYAKIAATRKTPEARSKRNKRMRERRADPTFRLKEGARGSVNRAIKNGTITRKPCEVCGTSDRIEAHHDDYSKPLDVRFLCQKHHNQHHRTIGLQS